MGCRSDYMHQTKEEKLIEYNDQLVRILCALTKAKGKSAIHQYLNLGGFGKEAVEYLNWEAKHAAFDNARREQNAKKIRELKEEANKLTAKANLLIQEAEKLSKEL